ncbi:MAG: 4-hydroxy-3-methylbut-2-enyl diphosphate reductase [Candidatus Omnitrophica bacterium]|nr:4-hydroxy-3-methylbut-2-enyl diphosphate reductase [Candidatus Omnitrophota bacterium]MCG2706384.1 4-hydroxy-3-methylbut-2-enyl diphosphate reductase [Candidatus Omnitrophota bacterium]
MAGGNKWKRLGSLCVVSISIAKNIGFCSGVRRAIDIVEQALSKSKTKVYSLGPVIHNHQAIKELKQKNLYTINSLDNIEDSSVVILPSHGSPRYILDKAKKKNLRLIDVTCPYVSSVHRICNKAYRQGFKVIIIGDRRHPEIRALVDLVKDASVIEKIKDIPENGFSRKKIGIISQTTQAKDTFFKIISRILQKNPKVAEVHIFNTICLDTIARQEEVKKLAYTVDVLLIIGSSISANTKRLFCIGRRINKRAYLIQTKDAPLNRILKNARTVGVISGASTPSWLVEEIIKKIRKRG